MTASPYAEETSYTYNPQKNRLLSTEEISFSYDQEGQLTTKATNTFNFDAVHRLQSISGEHEAYFSYDGAGKRLAATREGVTTRYIYDASGNLLAEADSSNNILSCFVYGNGLLAMVTPSNQTYCYHFDATGNTVAMTDTGRTIVNSYSYTPFGIIIGENETVPQPFKYVGQYGVMAEPNGFY